MQRHVYARPYDLRQVKYLQEKEVSQEYMHNLDTKND